MNGKCRKVDSSDVEGSVVCVRCGLMCGKAGVVLPWGWMWDVFEGGEAGRMTRVVHRSSLTIEPRWRCVSHRRP